MLLRQEIILQLEFVVHIYHLNIACGKKIDDFIVACKKVLSIFIIIHTHRSFKDSPDSSSGASALITITLYEISIPVNLKWSDITTISEKGTKYTNI